MIADKGYACAKFEHFLNEQNAPTSQALRQIIESVNDTLEGQLDPERHVGRTHAGVTTRVLQRILALTAAIWHNDHNGHTSLRSLIAYDY